MRKIDQDADGEISYTEFLRYFAKGKPEDTHLVTRMTNIDIDEACQMIREKIESRLHSGLSHFLSVSPSLSFSVRAALTPSL